MSALHHPQLLSCLYLLEAAENLARVLKMSSPWPTLEGVSVKLCQLVAMLKSTEDGIIPPAIVLVASAPAALVIAELIKKAGRLDERLGMDNVRVVGLVGTSGFCSRMQRHQLERKIEGFKNGMLDIIVASGVPFQELPTDSCRNVIQFDLAEHLDVDDLAHPFVVVRTRHPLASFLGRAFFKAMVRTDVFVRDLARNPKGLTQDSQVVYSRTNHSESARIAIGMAHITGGLTDALDSLIKQNGHRFPRMENWIAFADNHSTSSTTAPPTAAVNAIQQAIDYTFSDAQLLVEALNMGTLACERLEFVGDGALELIVTSYWTQRHPVAQIGKVDPIKSASVCNNFLAVICIELRLHRWINSSRPGFHNDLAFPSCYDRVEPIG